jgi:hypothetical protein
MAPETGFLWFCMDSVTISAKLSRQLSRLIVPGSAVGDKRGLAFHVENL